MKIAFANFCAHRNSWAKRPFIRFAMMDIVDVDRDDSSIDVSDDPDAGLITCP